MGKVVGSGEFRYELVPSWPKMPRYWDFRSTTDVAVNSGDEVHVFSRGNHPLTIWDIEGNFISSWGEGTFSNNEHGIFIAPNGNVWLVDAWYHIATEHAPDGELLRTLGNKLQSSGRIPGMPFNMPTGLAIAPNGDIFVSDGYGNSRVHRFDPEGDLLKSWGTVGTGPGEFAMPHNIDVDKNGRVFVCDRENNRIQIFDAEGAFLTEWTDLVLPADVWIEDEED